MQDFLDILKNHLQDFKFNTLIAGFMGGVVYVAFKSNLTRAQAFTSILIGFLTAYYVTPLMTLLAEKYIVTAPLSKEAESGIAFLLGLFALFAIPAVINKIKSVK